MVSARAAQRGQELAPAPTPAQHPHSSRPKEHVSGCAPAVSSGGWAGAE